MKEGIISMMDEKIPLLKKLNGKLMVRISASKDKPNYGANYSSSFYVKSINIGGNIISVEQTYSLDLEAGTIEKASASTKTRTIFIEKNRPITVTVDFDTDEGKAFFRGILLRPDIKCEGFPNFVNSSDALLEMTIPDIEVNQTVNFIKEINSAVNTILNYPITRLRDLIYFLKQSPFLAPNQPMSKDHAISRLIGAKFDGWALSKLKEFQKFHEISDTPTGAIHLMFYKGLQFKIISQKPNEYMLGITDFLGTTEVAAIDYLTRNQIATAKLAEAIAEYEGGRAESYLEKLKQDPVEAQVSNTVNLEDADEFTRIEEIRKLHAQGMSIREIVDATRLTLYMVNKYVNKIKEEPNEQEDE